MPAKRTYSLRLVALLLIVFNGSAVAQTSRELAFPISYVSAVTVYISGGRDDSVAVADTLRIDHGGKEICRAVVIAISRHSSAAQLLAGAPAVAPGDVAVLLKKIMLPALPRRDSVSAIFRELRPRLTAAEQTKQYASGAEDNIVSGRAALQYSGVIAANSLYNLNQPSALLRLEVAKLFGTGVRFYMYGRSYYDLSANYNRYGTDSRLKITMYEMTLSEDRPDGAYGFAVGRVTSQFVGGMGSFDGAQAYYRLGHFTTGVLYGAKVADRTMAIDGDDRRGSLFLNFQTGYDFLHRYEGTIAYVRQMYEGRLDREFFYLQNLATLGSQLNIYQSAEMETQDVGHGIRQSSLKISNAFFSLNYYPLSWFSANLGYDANKMVYLFETMKDTPDTLVDRNYLQGFRLNATVRLPYALSLAGHVTYRTTKENPRDARTIGSTLRWNSIAGSEFSTGLRYVNIRGVYNDGDNITFDVDRTFFYTLSLALRYDYYAYTLLQNKQSYVTHTATLSANYRISRAIYTALNFDSVWDSTMNSYRIYLEAGVRF